MAKKRNDRDLYRNDGLNVNPYAPDPDTSDDELGASSDGKSDGHKDYTVQRDGTVINGELLNQGDVVTLHPDDAAVLMNADVRLTEVPPSI